MDRRELAWRIRERLTTTAERTQSAVAAPRWNRWRLSAAITEDGAYADIRVCLRRGQWSAAHRAISDGVVAGPARFVIAPSLRANLAARIAADFPTAPPDAHARAARIANGCYDVLGYEGLSFGNGSVDWHFDPVHNRRAPQDFWAQVPFLAPECGDHKIIWELNRQQHLLLLGRGYWLTGDRAFRDSAIAHIESWLRANPPLTGINWASMLELAFRSISWVWALHFFADGTPAVGESAWCVDLLLGLDRQLQHIERHLSYYFSPNTHLLGEALALYVGGQSVPFLSKSAARAAIGRQILIDEMRRQILADGVHCERSTHYHRYALDFYLLALVIARITNDPAAGEFDAAVTSLATAARALADNDGRLPHFGDDDGGALFRIAGRPLDDAADALEASAALTGRQDLRVGIPTEEATWLLAHPSLAPTLDACRAAAAPAPRGSVALDASGYHTIRSPKGAHIVFDAGRHGYLNGGHAHADPLSLTLTVHGRPFLIDPGTLCYTMDAARRDRMRSSSLHNTLTLDERSAALPAGPFHWARAADASTYRTRSAGPFDFIDAAHSGYAPAVHRRRVLSLHDDLLVVADLVTGDGTHRADVHWHFDPSWAIALRSHGATASAKAAFVDISFPIGSADCFSADAEHDLGWHAPVYGRLEPNTTLRITRTAAAPFWVLTVFGLDPANAIERSEVMPVWSAAGVLDHSTAVKVVRASTTDYIVIAEPRAERHASTWRAGALETDAAALFCRFTRANEGPTEVALVDGSLVRASGRRTFDIELGSVVPAAHFGLDELAAPNGGSPYVRDRRLR